MITIRKVTDKDPAATTVKDYFYAYYRETQTDKIQYQEVFLSARAAMLATVQLCLVCNLRKQNFATLEDWLSIASVLTPAETNRIFELAESGGNFDSKEFKILFDNKPLA